MIPRLGVTNGPVGCARLEVSLGSPFESARLSESSPSMKNLRRGGRSLLLGAGPKRSKVRIRSRVFVVFLVAVLAAGILGITISVRVEDRETAASKAGTSQNEGR